MNHRWPLGIGDRLTWLFVLLGLTSLLVVVVAVGSGGLGTRGKVGHRVLPPPKSALGPKMRGAPPPSLNRQPETTSGSVVNLSGVKIEAFYGQNWAFARYLWEGENGRFRPALQKLLADTASGNVYDPTGSLRHSLGTWNPAAVQPMLEHYLGEPLPEIEKGYKAFVSKVAYEEMKAQFQLPG